MGKVSTFVRFSVLGEGSLSGHCPRVRGGRGPPGLLVARGAHVPFLVFDLGRLFEY